MRLYTGVLLLLQAGRACLLLGLCEAMAEATAIFDLCAESYLGMACRPDVVAAAGRALMADHCHSAPFNAAHALSEAPPAGGGLQDLQARLAAFLGQDACLLYNSVFEANAGVFAPLMGERDAILCDQLNNASIVDGIRLSKAQRYTYRHNDMADLAACMARARENGCRSMLVFTEGAFFIDGSVARLHTMREMCDHVGALLGVDDSHGTGVLGLLGRGSHELRGLCKDGRSQVDIITGTLDRALGGMAGGFVCARGDMVEALRQGSRPYLYGNPISAASVAATLQALDVLQRSSAPRDKLKRNALYFRRAITEIGFDIKAGIHPIVSILVDDTHTVQRLCQRLLELGVRVSGLVYPAAPPGHARVRVQVSALHELPELKRAVAAFKQAGLELGLLK